MKPFCCVALDWAGADKITWIKNAFSKRPNAIMAPNLLWFVSFLVSQLAQN
jgi:hypothetical protein